DTFTFTGIVHPTGGSGDALLVDSGPGRDTLTCTAASKVDGNARVHLGNGVDTLVIAGTIGRAGSSTDKLQVQGGHGGDRVALRGTAKINGTADVTLGNGNDAFALAAGASFKALNVEGGSGINTFYNNTGAKLPASV